MKKFTITYATQSLFSQGFRSTTCEVWGAVNAYRVLQKLRAMRIPPLMMRITCG